MKKLLSKLAKISLTRWIFIGLIAGFIIGLVSPEFAVSLKPLRTLFLNGIKCIIAPLIFSTLVSGIAGAGSFKQLGSMGMRAIIYFEIVTTLALFYGIAAVNLFKPGVGMDLAPAGSAPATTQTVSFGGFVEHLLPTNFVDAIARGDVLQIVILSTLFAIAIVSVGAKARPVVEFCESLAEIMFKFTGYIMWLAPLGVGAAMAASVGEHGLMVLVPMLKLIGTLYLALLVFVITVFLPVMRMFQIPIKSFFYNIKDAIALAFATTSSESAYPLALKSMERFGVPRRISSFVLPLGYSFNLDGSTLYLAIASVFVAQAAGMDLSIGTQLAIVASLMLTSKGVAAVPRATLVVLTGTLSSFGIPLEAVAVIIAVDEFMDMARTSVNLLGNCLATAVIARTEGNTVGVLPVLSSDAAVAEV